MFPQHLFMFPYTEHNGTVCKLCML